MSHRTAGARALRRLLLAAATLVLMVGLAPAAHAATSSNVAYVFDFGAGANDPAGPGSGSSIFRNALTGVGPGATYTTADASKTVSVTDVPLSAVNAGGVAALTPFDTVILYEVCSIGAAANAPAMAAINQYLLNGGKVMIFDADKCFDGTPANYSTFLFPFATSSPGPQGAGGSYTNVQASTLTTGLFVGPQTGDSVGDANNFTTFSNKWCGSITAQNTLANDNFVEAYARTPAGGIVIYEGEDFWFTFGPTAHLRLVFDLMLKQNFNPDGLPCALPASGIKLAPPTQSHPVGGTASVTATVVDANNVGQPGINVTFKVLSGPDAGTTGNAVTDGSGNAPFSYTCGAVGTDTVEATFTDDFGGVHQSNDVTVDCTDPPITAAGTAITSTEGAPVTAVVATFTDPDPGATAAEYAATITWGDGNTSAGTITGGGGSFSVSGTNTYAEEGAYAISVSIVDLDNAANSATASSTATVADAAIAATSHNVTGVEGASLTGVVASFTDANPGGTTSDFSATINWGDTFSSAGTVTPNGSGGWNVSGTHTYAEEGSYTVTVTVNDVGGSTASAAGTASIADAALTAAGEGTLLSTASFSGQVAHFSDADPNGTVSDYTASINWGDGSPATAGTISALGSGFAVSGSHTYATTGFFTVTTTIKDVGGSTATATTTILIFGTSAGGNFVVGDGNSAVGTQVTFWGAQWWKLNTLSGGAAPAAFKGFENSPSTLPSCRTPWTTDPGNSSGPPASIPGFMAVLVSGSISKSGSTISGDTPHIVIVKTDTGYAPNPGHAGTGKVVAVLC